MTVWTLSKQVLVFIGCTYYSVSLDHEHMIFLLFTFYFIQGVPERTDVMCIPFGVVLVLTCVSHFISSSISRLPNPSLLTLSYINIKIVCVWTCVCVCGCVCIYVCVLCVCVATITVPEVINDMQILVWSSTCV